MSGPAAVLPIAGNEPRKINLPGIEDALAKPTSKQIHGRRFSNVAPLVASSIVLALGIGSLVSLFVIIGLVEKGILIRNTPLFNKIYIPLRCSAPFTVLIGGLLTVGFGMRCANNNNVTKKLANTNAREISVKSARMFLRNFSFSSYKREDLSASEKAVLDQIKQGYKEEIKRELDVPHNQFVEMIGRRVSPRSKSSFISVYWEDHILLAELHEGNHAFNDQQNTNLAYLRRRLNKPAPVLAPIVEGV